DAFAFECPSDGAEAHAGVVHLEDAAHDGRGVRVGLEGAEPGAGRGLRAIGMRETGVDEPVAVVGASAEPAPVRGESEHRSARAELDARRSAFESPPNKLITRSCGSLSGSTGPPTSGTHSSPPW